MDEAHDQASRSRLLAAYVEIMLAASDVRAARAGADEVAAIAEQLEAPLLRAMAAHATGATLLAEGDGRAALSALRGAWAAWQGVEAPYEAARARVLIALACRALGDHDTAHLVTDPDRMCGAHDDRPAVGRRPPIGGEDARQSTFDVAAAKVRAGQHVVERGVRCRLTHDRAVAIPGTAWIGAADGADERLCEDVWSIRVGEQVSGKAAEPSYKRRLHLAK